MYSIYSFGRMISDSRRMDAYVEALRRAVKDDSVVLDIGTGTGIFALLASQFGARKVYATEPDNAINLAKEFAAVNRLADKIEFIQDLSTNVILPEAADVIISDLRGVLPLFQHHIPSIADARRRLLAPNGILIPQEDKIWATVVEARSLHKPFEIPWSRNAYNLDMRAGQAIVTNTWHEARLNADQFLVEPQKWATLDYGSIEDPNIHAELRWTATRSGTAHGLAMWFDAILAEGIGFSNSPDSPELIYGNAFFPLSAAVAIEEGDSIELRVAANLVGDDYIWRWDTRITGANGLKADFKQSTFFAEPLSLKQLSKRASNYVPQLSAAAQIDLAVLELMNQAISLNEIAEQILGRFPKRFKNLQSTLAYVGELSLKYSV
jgi:type I protein arginine methyltransferase